VKGSRGVPRYIVTEMDEGAVCIFVPDAKFTEFSVRAVRAQARVGVSAGRRPRRFFGGGSLSVSDSDLEAMGRTR
jgi:hypothetical protein